jgi:hypothetical protein
MVFTSPVSACPETRKEPVMKPSLLVLAAGLGASTLAFAQQTGSATAGVGVAGMEPTVSSQAFTLVVVQPQACPVYLAAKQAGATEMVKIDRGQDPTPPIAKPGQRIRLFLTGLEKTGKVTATVTVHGLSARARIDKTSVAGTSDLRRTMNVALTREDDKTVWAELVLPGFTSVKSVKLDALQFEDGSTRDFAGLNLCTVAPDPLMLVAGR